MPWSWWGTHPWPSLLPPAESFTQHTKLGAEDWLLQTSARRDQHQRALMRDFGLVFDLFIHVGLFFSPPTPPFPSFILALLQSLPKNNPAILPRECSAAASAPLQPSLPTTLPSSSAPSSCIRLAAAKRCH